jgi:hypothetical protein
VIRRLLERLLDEPTETRPVTSFASRHYAQARPAESFRAATSSTRSPAAPGQETRCAFTRDGGCRAAEGRASSCVQSMTAVASTSTRRSGSASAATPTPVSGGIGVTTPSFTAARATPSTNRGILSGVKSTT